MLPPGTVAADSKEYVIPVADKVSIRNTIVDGVLASAKRKLVSKQLLEALKLMVREDFKKECDVEFVNKVVGILHADDLQKVETAVKIIRKMLQTF